MNNLMEKLVKDYQGYAFSSGSHTGNDYVSFQRKFKSALSKMAKEIGASLVSFNGSHYEFSAFLERDGSYVYLSISDVRYWQDGWIDDILIRTATGPKDYTGGVNNRASLYNLQDEVESMLN